MIRSRRGCAVAILLVIGFVALALIGDRFYFRSDARQLAILQSYLPGVSCEDAVFDAISIDDGVFDYGYKFALRADRSCISDIRTAMKARGFQRGPVDDGTTAGGWAKREQSGEVVVFWFGEDGRSAIWLRDKT